MYLEDKKNLINTRANPDCPMECLTHSTGLAGKLHMKKISKNIFNFLASINVAIFAISSIVLLTLLQLAGAKYQTVYKDWQWLKTLASIDFFQSKVTH